MSDARALLSVPTPVAEAMIADGKAEYAPARRGTALEVIADGAVVAATTISLLQGPVTVRELASYLRAMLREKLEGGHDAGRIVVRAKGPGGSLEVTAGSDADLEQIESLLERTVFAAAHDDDD